MLKYYPIISLFACIAASQISVKKTSLKTVKKLNLLLFYQKDTEMWRFSAVSPPLYRMPSYLLAFSLSSNKNSNTTLIVISLGMGWEDVQYYKSIMKQLLHCHGTWQHDTYFYSKYLVNKKVKEAISGGIQFYCVPCIIWLQYKLTPGRFLLLESQRWPRALYQA